MADALLSMGLPELAEKLQKAPVVPPGTFVRAGPKHQWCVRCPPETQSGDHVLVTRRDQTVRTIQVGELVHSANPRIRHILRPPREPTV